MGPVSGLPFGDVNHPSFLPDGDLIFNRESGNTHTIWRWDFGDPVQITGTDVDRVHPSARQSDGRIVFVADTNGDQVGDQIRLIWPDGSGETTIYAPGWPVSGPAWHPNGDLIVLAERVDEDLYYRIKIIDTDGDVQAVLTSGEGTNDITPYFSFPDGEWIIFVRDVGIPSDPGIGLFEPLPISGDKDIYRIHISGDGLASLYAPTSTETVVIESNTSCNPQTPRRCDRVREYDEGPGPEPEWRGGEPWERRP